MAKAGLCSIAGCGKPVKGRGWCSAHIAKWRKYGDPLASVRRPTQYGPCAMPGCSKQGASSRSMLCGAHYKRRWRYGDPNKGAEFRAASGEPLAWLIAHVAHVGEDCLKWPFADRGNGYGCLNNEAGEFVGAHREMCRKAHGEPPSADHAALHSCGMGHEGCVNPQHLRWGTVTENAADRYEHGTMKLGEDVHNAKLTEDDVKAIRAAVGKSQNELAREFGVNQATIWKILHRLAWRWLK
ncbi:hypothetical protein [Sphingomonas crocodyli]|uniref:HTH cro/C1-type domain-containing protein n=1 Tax=Sphingomonas crocodyli TaxID=1979270 RepID=A0A437M7Y7_9SPHN|nr:hypothetical protein [Sphingomonas crocodyli]RVT93697.1 hypothetical protein EOD43_07470 [Sphingomonas crocodyli]